MDGGWIEKKKNRWMVGWMDRKKYMKKMDGWMDKKIDGWLDGWI